MVKISKIVMAGLLFMSNISFFDGQALAAWGKNKSDETHIIKKETYLASLKKENADLKEQLKAANKQLEDSNIRADSKESNARVILSDNDNLKDALSECETKRQGTEKKLEATVKNINCAGDALTRMNSALENLPEQDEASIKIRKEANVLMNTFNKTGELLSLQNQPDQATVDTADSMQAVEDSATEARIDEPMSDMRQIVQDPAGYATEA